MMQEIREMQEPTEWPKVMRATYGVVRATHRSDAGHLWSGAATRIVLSMVAGTHLRALGVLFIWPSSLFLLFRSIQ